jgi:rod shape-determining protein MreD
MNWLRPVAALAAMLTAMLVQAALIAPIATTATVSLPAVLVAAVAVSDGAAAGLTLGFATGLLADLGSTHPAGVLALVWMLLGAVCGLAAPSRRLRSDAITVAGCCVIAAAAATLLLAVVHGAGASVGTAMHALLPDLLGDTLLAAIVVPVVRAALRGETLRAPHPSTRGLDHRALEHRALGHRALGHRALGHAVAQGLGRGGRD